MSKIFKMRSLFLWFMLFNKNISLLLTEDIHPRDLRKLIEIIQRRRYLDNDYDILDIPRSVEDLPEAEPIHPGHTLLQPTRGMLKSSVKFPHKDAGNMAVYGNLKNLGLTFGKTQQRWLYTNFRKTDTILTYLLEKAIRNIKKNKHLNKSGRNPVVIIEIDPANLKQMQNDYPLKENSDKLSDIENNTSEILDRSIKDNEGMLPSLPTRRRSRKRGRHSRFRERDSSMSTDSSDASSESSDYERNPGNPYTVHRDKYKQNWMWNHFMDGDHMNINPHAPQFSGVGPSGAALFFGRKWWYYNQDDYQPLQK